MSAFTITVSRDQEPVAKPQFLAIMAALNHRGPDGKRIVWRSSAALGFQHFRTTREDVSTRQPIHDPDRGIDLVFDGRLDNRTELVARLDSLVGEDASELSDARLALAAYREWGRGCFDRLLGPFAMAVFDQARHLLICARDPLGDRTLCYRFGRDGLAVASEASALLRGMASPRLDETTLAHFFAVEAPPAGTTFFEGVRELPPGHLLTFDGHRSNVERYWRPEDTPEVRYRRDGEYVEHFRQLLTESVRCRLRASNTPAVLMSGGLDSTSVAALAARELTSVGAGGRLRSISWVFDELPAADERTFMDPVVERWGLEARRIAGDGEWPLRELDSWPVNRDAPWQGPYCRLQNRAYAAARDAGAQVLLTGEYGDHLYADEVSWLRDLVAEGRWLESLRLTGRELAGQPLRALLRSGRTRSALARTLGWRGRRSAGRHWLTPYAHRRLEDEGRQSPGAADRLAAFAASGEIPNASGAGIEVRRPYRDRRLVELMLAIPAHLVYRPGWAKWILRQAMDGILPEPVRLRRRVSSLLPLAARGLVEREAESVRQILSAPNATWRRFVRPEWLASAFPHRLRRNLDGVETVVPWQCLCMHLWTFRYPFAGPGG